jgi:hypothetical protein
MKKWILPLSVWVAVSWTSCGPKKDSTPNNYISVVSLIQKEVAHIDTSLFTIVKTVFYDSTRTDTIYVSREDFRKEARDFLEIPDLAERKVAKRYKDVSPIYDQSLGRVIFKYEAIEPDKEEVKSQEFLATPVPGADAKINNVIIIREISNRDSFLQKKMLWRMNQSFQIVTTTQKPGQPEKTTVTKVAWNEDPYQ